MTKLVSFANSGVEKAYFDAKGGVVIQALYDCSNCKRSVGDHTEDGKCLFGSTQFEDARAVSFFQIQSPPMPGGKKWTLELRSGGKLVYTDVRGNKRSLSIDKLFQQFGEPIE